MINCIQKILIIITLLLSLNMNAADLGLPSFDKLWINKNVKRDTTGKTWTQSGPVAMTMSSTKSHVENIMTSLKFNKRHDIDQKVKGKKCNIILWIRTEDKLQVITMLSEVDISKTYLYWGVIKNEK